MAPPGQGHRFAARVISAGLIATILGYTALVVFLARITRAVDGALEQLETIIDETRR